MIVTDEMLFSLLKYTKEELEEIIPDGSYGFILEPEGDQRGFSMMTGKGGLIMQVEALRELKEVKFDEESFKDFFMYGESYSHVNPNTGETRRIDPLSEEADKIRERINNGPENTSN